MANRNRMLAAGAALIVLLIALGVALSVVHHAKKDDYAAFGACPLRDPPTDLCLFTRTTGGEFVAGDRTVPLSRAVTLQGGVHVVENAEREIVKDEFIAAADGETLSRTPQPVPGGLRAIVDPSLLSPASQAAFNEILARGAAAVTATIELAAPASSIGIDVQNLVEARGTALVLPVKIRLSNPFLGENCYIGANAHPIVVALTTGSSASTHLSASHRPLAGKPGHAKFKDHYNLIVLSDESLLSDSFAAPRAEGCGGTGSPAIDRAVDARLGLPAAAGRNRAVLNVTLQDANAPAVVGFSR